MKKNRCILTLFLAISIILHATLFSGIARMAWFNIASSLPIGVFLTQEPQMEKGRTDFSQSVISPPLPSRQKESAPEPLNDRSAPTDSPTARDEAGKVKDDAENVNSLTVPAKELKAPDRTPPGKMARLANEEILAMGKHGQSVEMAGPRREKLTFNIYWMGIYVGKATLEAVREGGKITITSNVRSNAAISAFYKVEDNAESRLVDNRAVNFKLRQSEGTHKRDREIIFDLANRKVIFLNHLDKTRDEHDSGGKVLWDVISAFYYVRTQPLEVGKSVYLDMFDNNKFLKTEVKVLRKERMKLFDDREVDTVVVEPVLNSEGLFQKSGEIYIWLTDDKERVPVRMETSVKIGKVSAVLKGSEVER